MGKVLIVEDDCLTCLDLKIRLESMGHQVVEFASTYDQALRSAFIYDPDIVLMDISINGSVDGIEAADIISTRFDIPVIFITGHIDQAIRTRAIKIEKSFCLSKPFSEILLNGVIEYLMADISDTTFVRQASLE